MNKTKKSLIASLLILCLCFTSLIGTTFAWFTDSVTSAGNVIKSGRLDVEMTWKDATSNGAQQTYVDASAGAIFNYDKWEPGYVEAKNIVIKNNGTLALKYTLAIVATDFVSALSDVIEVYYAEGEYTLAGRNMSELAYIGTLTDVLDNMSTTANGDLIAGESDKVTIALKMKESAGNEYQELDIGTTFAIKCMATQLTAEKDSFDDQYDAMATIDSIDELNAALAADYDVIMLGANLNPTESIVIPAEKTVTIDLCGYKISQTVNDLTTAYAMIENKGNLTIIDSMGSGKISFADATPYTSDIGWASNTIKNLGTLVINGGTVENVTSKAVMNFSYPHAIDAYQGSVTTINGGIVKSLNYDSIRMFCNSATEATTVNINGGTIVNRVSFQDPNGNAAGYGRLNITGGKFVTTDDVNANVRLLNFCNLADRNMKATVTGGTFDKGFKTQNHSSADVKTSDWLNSDSGAIAVTTAADLAAAVNGAEDGDVIEFYADITGNVTLMRKENVNVVINGNGNKFTGVMTMKGEFPTGSFTINNINFVAAAGEKINIFVPAKYVAENGHEYNNYVSNIIVNGCTFTDPDASRDCVAVSHEKGGKHNWTLNDCTVDNTMHSLLQASNIQTSLKITNCKVYSKNGVNLNYGEVLEMSGCTFDVTGYAVRFGVAGATVNGNYTISDSSLKSAVAESGDAVIVCRGAMEGSTLTITNTTLTGTPDITGNAKVIR